ncbi:hypothetical protein N665_2153s0004 [Sinapis alba]|nr:hypothetical protein N665_2153s0004 [Sinapis alba]
MSQGDNFQSVNSESVISSSSTDHGVHCACNRTARIQRAWTRDNPEGRFLGCKGRRVGNKYVNCKFFQWFDMEPPYGWQYLALLEARGIIREQKEEIENLRDQVSKQISTYFLQKLDEKNEECQALKRQVLVLSKRTLVLRNVLAASSVGFVVVLGGIIGLYA